MVRIAPEDNIESDDSTTTENTSSQDFPDEEPPRVRVVSGGASLTVEDDGSLTETQRETEVVGTAPASSLSPPPSGGGSPPSTASTTTADMGEPDIADQMDRDIGAQDRDLEEARRREVDAAQDQDLRAARINRFVGSTTAIERAAAADPTRNVDVIAAEANRDIAGRRRTAFGGIDDQLEAAEAARAGREIDVALDFDRQVARANTRGSAVRSELLRRAEVNAEQAIEDEFGREVDLDQSDIEVSRADDGTFGVELTASGRAKVATAPLTEFVDDVDAFAEDVFDVGLPDVGPLVTEIEADEPKAGFGELVERRERGEFVSAGDFADAIDVDVLDPIEDAILDATELQDPAVLTGEARPGRAGAAKRLERRNFDIEAPGIEPTRQFSQEVLRGGPLLVTSGAGFLLDAAEVGGRAGGALARGDFDGLGDIEDEVLGEATEKAVLVSATAVDAPGEFAARGAGTLVASGGLFGAARAVGPRASLATRGLVQPGEEIAGIGGFGVTRRLAGEPTAQRLFPNKEPLIFSEEAFLRGVGAAGRRVSSGVERVGRRGRIEAKSAEFKFAELRSGEVETRLDSFDFGGRMFSGPIPVPRRRRRPREFEREAEEFELDIEEATEPELVLEAEQEVLGRRRVETSLAEQQTDLQRVDTRTTIEQELDQEVIQEVDQEVDTEIEDEIDTEIDTEIDQEVDTDVEQEFFETELEIETETELEFEPETEFELEVEPPRDPRQRRDRAFEPLEFDLFDRELEFRRDLSFFAEVEADLGEFDLEDL